MPDKLSPEQRHRNMAAIRSKNTRPEMAVRRFLHAHGYRYRLHVKSVPTTPDIVLRNRERDERDRKELTRLGWNVIRIWECELKPSRREATLQSLLMTLSKIELSIANARNSVKYDFDIDLPQKMVADDGCIHGQ